MTPREIAEGIVRRYSDSDLTQTICRPDDLIRDIEHVVSAYKREKDQAVQVHESWLELQRKYDKPKRRWF